MELAKICLEWKETGEKKPDVCGSDVKLKIKVIIPTKRFILFIFCSSNIVALCEFLRGLYGDSSGRVLLSLLVLLNSFRIGSCRREIMILARILKGESRRLYAQSIEVSL